MFHLPLQFSRGRDNSPVWWLHPACRLSATLAYLCISNSGKSVCIQSAEDNSGGKKNLISLQHGGRLGFNLLKSIGRFDQEVSFRDIQIAGTGSVCIGFKKENRCPHAAKKKNGAVVLKTRSQRCRHRAPAAGPEVSAETPLRGEEGWERMGRTCPFGSLALKAAQPSLCDVYHPLTVRGKRAGSKMTVSPETALPSAERPKNSWISQMNSPAQLLQVYSSWHSRATPHTAYRSRPAALTQLWGQGPCKGEASRWEFSPKYLPCLWLQWESEIRKRRQKASLNPPPPGS